MTEDEAKTRMCCGPQTVAMAVLIAAPTGTVEITGNAGLCIASACMAWRTEPGADLSRARAYAEANEKVSAIKSIREAFPDFGLLEAKEVIEGKRPWPTRATDGYCGLAGAAS